MNGNAPWKDTLFGDYISEKAGDLDIERVSEALAEYREIDEYLIGKLNALFMEFMGDDLSFPTLGRMVTAQGYETVNNMNRFIETYLDGHPQRLYVREENMVRPNPRSRVVSFGDWNVRHTEEADYYPLFALGLLRSVDPFFNGRKDYRIRTCETALSV